MPVPRFAGDLDGDEETEVVGFGVEERDDTEVAEEALVVLGFAGVVTDLFAGVVEDGRAEPVFQGGREGAFFPPSFVACSAFNLAGGRS